MHWPKPNFTPIMKWCGRWLLPVFFYGIGLGFILPILNQEIGWSNIEGVNTQTTTDEIVYDSTTCQTVVGENGTLIETCQDVSWTRDINIFEVDSFGFSDILFSVRFVVGVIALAIAYKLTPKPTII